MSIYSFSFSYLSFSLKDPRFGLVNRIGGLSIRTKKPDRNLSGFSLFNGLAVVQNRYAVEHQHVLSVKIQEPVQHIDLDIADIH